MLLSYHDTISLIVHILIGQAATDPGDGIPASAMQLMSGRQAQHEHALQLRSRACYHSIVRLPTPKILKQIALIPIHPDGP
jgi:hypothetical protein